MTNKKIVSIFILLSFLMTHLSYGQVSQSDLNALKEKAAKMKERLVGGKKSSPNDSTTLSDNSSSQLHMKGHINYNDLVDNPEKYLNTKVSVDNVNRADCYFDYDYIGNNRRISSPYNKRYSQCFIPYKNSKGECKIIFTDYADAMFDKSVLATPLRGVLKKMVIPQDILEDIEKSCNIKISSNYYVVENDLNINRYWSRIQSQEFKQALWDNPFFKYGSICVVILGAFLTIKGFFKK